MFRANLTRNGKFQKNRKKFKKIKRIPLWLHFKQKHVEKGRERRKTKIIVPFRSYPTSNRNSKNIEKKFQKFKNTIVASFQATICWNRPRKRENKNYDSASFQPDA